MHNAVRKCNVQKNWIQIKINDWATIIRFITTYRGKRLLLYLAMHVHRPSDMVLWQYVLILCIRRNAMCTGHIFYWPSTPAFQSSEMCLLASCLTRMLPPRCWKIKIFVWFLSTDVFAIFWCRNWSHIIMMLLILLLGPSLGDPLKKD